MEERRARLDDVLRRRVIARQNLHDELRALDEEEREIYQTPGCDHTGRDGKIQTYTDMNDNSRHCCWCDKRI